MSKYFMHSISLAELEREMMSVPNFAPRRHGLQIRCGYRSAAADEACKSCLLYRCRSFSRPACPCLAERLEAGVVPLEELAMETIRPWKHLQLKQRVMDVAGRVKSFHFQDQFHIMRMLEMTENERGRASSRWLAAVYLLSSQALLWQRAIAAVAPDQIDFSKIRLRGVTLQNYVTYRVAKGVFHGTPGAASDELADAELVNDETLLLILCAALIARYGPQVMKIGRDDP